MVLDAKALAWAAKNDIDTAKLMHGGIDQFFYLIPMGDVCPNGDCLSTAAIQFIGQ